MGTNIITEQEAAGQFCLSIAHATQDAWPVISKHLLDAYKEKFFFSDESIACYDFTLATMALELEALKGIFSPAQTGRIYSWVLKILDTPDWGAYSKEEFKEYQKAFEDDVRNREYLLSGVSARLLCRWLGRGIENFEVKLGNKRSGIIDPLLVIHVSSLLPPFLGYWKKVKDTHDLVEGDLPLNFDESPKSPLNVGGTKASDRKFKVLIKGPWDEVKEELWEIDDETARKFVDKNNIAYAICYFEKRQPQYLYVQKRIWEKSDDLEKILADSSLTEEQRMAKIKGLIEDSEKRERD